MTNSTLRLYRIVFAILIIILPGKLFAQVSAAFSATPLSGCSPIVVRFTDQSTGNPTQWRWDLGNGVTSILQNPSTSYFNPGTYTVKLVASNGTSADSVIKIQYITVYPNPVSNFTASDTTGCFPFPVQFNNLSTTSSGTITSWNWDFGDGTISTAQNPMHVYNTAGNFTVTLRVTNNYGCSKTFSKPQYIQVANGVTADFTNTTPAQCTTPATINFTNTSTGPGTLIYTWNFGDGSGSNAVNPVHTYSSPGSYTVTLITESSQGCRDTIIKPNLISIGTINSQFTSPDSVCQNQSFTITNTSTPTPSGSFWDFGDGTTSTQINPVKTYINPGTYTIKLVNYFSGCSDSTTRQIFVRQAPDADFTSNQTTSCKLPFTVNFTGANPGSNNFIWNFGDGSTGTGSNPIHTYTTAGNFTVTLIVINAAGCRDTIVKPQYIQIQEPVASINNLPRNGCTPLTISPTATVTSNEPVVSYLWNFGDGTTSTAANPNHTYNTAGTYTVSLIITTASGCTDTVIMNNAVRAGDKPDAAFTVNPTDVCAFQPVQFTDNSTGNVDQWYWQFGDGGTSSVQNPSYIYSDTGYFSVTLIVWSNTCPDTIRLTNIVHIKPPIARFTINRTCSDKYKIDFVDQSIGATGWTWDFGDGTNSSLQNPSHTYSATGNYTVTLTVTNGSCSHTTRQTVRIIDEHADFIVDNTTVCKGSPVRFTIINANAANITSWQWNFGDGGTATTPSSATHTYTASGIYTVTLIITDILGCRDTAGISITVYGPTAQFAVSSPTLCLGSDPVIFTDASTTDGTHPIIKWIWNYGDGTIDSLSAPPYTHLYTATGTYNVTLTVVDNSGCRHSVTKSAAVIISKPRAGFYSPDTLSCTNKPVSFVNTSTGTGLQFNWNFGDGLTATTASPVHYYTNVGLYNVSLSVTDQYGCKDSITKNQYINISLPRASFTVSDSFSTCPPLLVNFTNSSVNYISLRWDFGDGNISTLTNPSHYYTIPGVYFAKLYVTGPGGCIDSMSKKIDVRGPRGSFTYTPIKGCDPHTVTFTATTLDRISFVWDFSDGSTVSTTDSVISHTYILPGEYVPKMILQDASGCTVPIIGTDTIVVVGITPRIGLNAYHFCDSGYVNFHDLTITNDLITNWQWSFGDGSFSNQQNPSHQYISPGVYDIKLVITTATGCKDSVLLNDTIKVFRSPDIAILGDSTDCVPGQLDFNGQIMSSSTALNWQWNLGNGNTSQQQNPPPQLYLAAGNYVVTSVAVDQNGCKDSVVKNITIHPLPNTNAGADAVVCIGSSMQLHATGATTYTWDPSPDLSCTNCADPVISPDSSATYVVTGTTQFGCTRQDSVYIKVQPRIVLQLTPRNDTICVGESVRLIASGADQYIWSPSNGLDNANIASPRATPATTTTYNVVGKDNANCFSDTLSARINVYPIPIVEAGADTTIIVGSSAQLHATGSPDITSWRWLNPYNLSCVNCPNPVAAPKQTTQYTLEVRNDGSCLSRDQLTVFVVCNKGNLFIPNTFSPNGDGMNDRFYPRGTGIALIKSIMIFNRWGEVVFERTNFSANDISAGWDGKYKGKSLTPDVFVFVCEVVCENKEILTYKGDITLIQ